MPLEPRTVAAEVALDAEIHSLSLSFWMGLVLTIPVLAIAMGGWLGINMVAFIPKSISKWTEFALTTPVVVWTGRLFFVRGWKSIVNRSLNMFAQRSGSLIPADFPGFVSGRRRSGALFRGRGGDHRVGFDGPTCSKPRRVAAPARQIKALLGLAPKTAHRVRNGQEEDVPVDDIQKGDQLRVRPCEDSSRRRPHGKQEQHRRVHDHG